MFVKNDKAHQGSFFNDVISQLSESKKKVALNSVEFCFHDEVFLKINEEDFSLLYSNVVSRPNTPVNFLVSALILRSFKGWTFAELFSHLDFNILTRLALGIYDLEEIPFCPATLFNFQNRILIHFNESGENLLKGVFDQLTAGQLKKYKVKTGIQRTDSFQLMSNIAKFSRLRLIIEVLRRLCRVIPKADKLAFEDLLSPFTKASSSEKYCYELDDEQLPSQLSELAKIYHQLYSKLSDSSKKHPAFKLFERVYNEQFELNDDGEILVKKTSQLNSSCLQSPDDIDATFRTKRGESYKGQVANVTETADPENEFNLITDICVENNNVNDNTIIAKQIDELKQKTPDLEELHADGAYGGQESDQKMIDNDVTLVTTACTGRKAAVPIYCSQNDDGTYKVSCPEQSVNAQKTATRYKAVFDLEGCRNCPYQEQCKVKKSKKGRVHYFTEETVKAHTRVKNIEKIPPERRNIRPNVEATVKQFTKGYNHVGKLNVRGKFKAELYAFTAGIGINLGRIYRNVA